VAEDLINHRIVEELRDAVAAARPVVMATVIETRRSVPRHAGSKMLVYGDGSITGSVGGGEMEARVIEEAGRAHADGKPRLVSYQLTDPGRGDPGVCGGEMTLYLEAYMPASTVFVIGCGHIGRAVVELADWMGFRVVAYDDRSDLADAGRLPGADQVLTGDFDEAVENAPITSQTHVVLVSRNMDLDVGLLPGILSSPARSVGVMGSATRWRATRKELLERGVAAESLDKLRAPIGLELNAETPEEIAVSILGEIVKDRRGGTGEHMSDAVP
jgi:xanthine dehydrogenase accessory factor